MTKPLTVGRVARFWGLLPSQFRALPSEEKAELHALYDVEQEVEGYYKSEEARIMDQISKEK
jgi:hypothetical protein